MASPPFIRQNTRLPDGHTAGEIEHPLRILSAMCSSGVLGPLVLHNRPLPFAVAQHGTFSSFPRTAFQASCVRVLRADFLPRSDVDWFAVEFKKTCAEKKMRFTDARFVEWPQAPARVCRILPSPPPPPCKRMTCLKQAFREYSNCISACRLLSSASGW